MKKFSSVLSVVLILCLFMAFAAGSSSDTSVSKAPADNNSAPASSEKEDAVAPGNVTVGVGETLTVNNLKITYVKCEEITNFDAYCEPAEGNTVYCLSFKFENNSSTDHFVSFYDFDCYADNEAAELYLYGDNTLSATVSPGRTASGNVYFEVPADATEIEVEYTTDFWSNDKAIFTVK